MHCQQNFFPNKLISFQNNFPANRYHKTYVENVQLGKTSDFEMLVPSPSNIKCGVQGRGGGN